jgi:hypothetical protein
MGLRRLPPSCSRHCTGISNLHRIDTQTGNQNTGSIRQPVTSPKKLPRVCVVPVGSGDELGPHVTQFNELTSNMNPCAHGNVTVNGFCASTNTTTTPSSAAPTAHIHPTISNMFSKLIRVPHKLSSQAVLVAGKSKQKSPTCQAARKKTRACLWKSRLHISLVRVRGYVHVCAFGGCMHLYPAVWIMGSDCCHTVCVWLCCSGTNGD